MDKLKILMMAALMFLAGSCSKSAGTGAGVQVQLSLSGPATRLALGEEESGTYPLRWQTGDRVSLNGVVSSPLSEELSGKGVAAFSFAAFSGSAPYKLLYPASASGEILLDGNTLGMYAYGTSLDEVFLMHHLCCGVRLSLTGDLSLASLTLSAPGGEKIAGRFVPSFTDGTLAELSGVNQLTVDWAEPAALSDIPQSFYLFFAPDTFSQGLSLQARNAAGTICREWRFATGKTLVRGMLYLLPETAFSSRHWDDGCIVALEGMSEEPIDFVL